MTPKLSSNACAQTGRNLAAPFEISTAYKPSGHMGENNSVQTRSVEGVRADLKPGLCTKVSYKSVGEPRWAGVYWQVPPNNWGDKSGLRVVDASIISFWAVGEEGGEIVEFKAGGIEGKQYTDSFGVSLGNVRLTQQWKRFEISLKGHNLSSVIGAFAWIATSDDNPGGLTFYLDAINYEKSPPASGKK